MTEETNIPVKDTSIYYPLFQNIFELVDITSYAWQPVLKAIGRTQLEVASLQARQTRAWMQWLNQLTKPSTPADFMTVSAQLWTAMVDDYLDTAPRVAAAVETAAEAVAPKVVELPSRPVHDTLILLDRDSGPIPDRKVA